MQAQKANWVQYISLGLVAVMMLAMFFNVGNVLRVKDTSVTPEFPTAKEIADAIKVPVTDSDKIDEIYEDMFEDNAIRDQVREMIYDEAESKDFARALTEVLNDELNGSFEIDSYRDITKVVIKEIKDEDIIINGEDATVEFEVKVYYFVDDDEDEEGKALVSVELDVEDLDVVEDFDDAEINEYDDSEFTFEKFYSEDYR